MRNLERSILKSCWLRAQAGSGHISLSLKKNKISVDIKFQDKILLKFRNLSVTCSQIHLFICCSYCSIEHTLCNERHRVHSSILWALGPSWVLGRKSFKPMQKLKWVSGVHGWDNWKQFSVVSSEWFPDPAHPCNQRTVNTFLLIHLRPAHFL